MVNIIIYAFHTFSLSCTSSTVVAALENNHVEEDGAIAKDDAAALELVDSRPPCLSLGSASSRGRRQTRHRVRCLRHVEEDKNIARAIVVDSARCRPSPRMGSIYSNTRMHKRRPSSNMSFKTWRGRRAEHGGHAA